jgi:hypothetical protein
MKRKTKQEINASIKFIPASQRSQTYYYSRTNRKASYKDLNLYEAKKPKKRKKN